MNQLQPLIHLLSGQFGWFPAFYAWVTAIMTASRFCVKPWATGAQQRLTAAMAEAAASADPEDDRDWEAVLTARWYRLTALALDVFISFKLPRHADFVRLASAAPLKGQPASAEQHQEQSNEGTTMQKSAIETRRNDGIERLFQLLLVPALLLGFATLVGCAGGPGGQVGVDVDNQQNITGSAQIDVATNVTVGAHVTGNPNTGEVSGGIVVTFNREPSSRAVDALKAAGAVIKPEGRGPRAAWVWVLPKWDYRDQVQSRAVEEALREGATLSRAN